MTDVTQILAAIDQGHTQAAEQLLPLVYEELRKLAAARLAHEKPGQTLQATALVHEAYLRLVGPGVGSQVSGVETEGSEVRGPRPENDQPTPDHRPPTPDSASFSSRGHFFAAAAEAMRRILVEAARRKKRIKRGGDWSRKDFLEDSLAAPEIHEDLVALDEALDRLKAIDPQAVQLVHLRYFAGLSIPQAAEHLGISPRTADRVWSFARAWLHREINGAESQSAEK
jgi:RNA polymerase sigma factor (sigma-70 family)